MSNNRQKKVKSDFSGRREHSRDKRLELLKIQHAISVPISSDKFSLDSFTHTCERKKNSKKIPSHRVHIHFV